MRKSNRFISVRGKARRWLEDDLLAGDELFEATSREGNEPVDHDGWQPIAPRKRYVRAADLVRARQVVGRPR